MGNDEYRNAFEAMNLEEVDLGPGPLRFFKPVSNNDQSDLKWCEDCGFLTVICGHVEDMPDMPDLEEGEWCGRQSDGWCDPESCRSECPRADWI